MSTNMTPAQEQAIARDWLQQNGHDHPEAKMARMGASDWLAEECLQMDEYRKFIAGKLQDTTMEGFKPIFIPDFLFDFQQYQTDWHIRKGKSAGFDDCGMGKSIMELVFADNVVRHTNKPVLILTPLSVGQQFVDEGEKFGIECRRSKDGKILKTINIANYERLHYFNPHDFGGVVCDESSCIKGFNTKRRDDVTEFLRTIPYRLMATATAAPNDYIELGTTSEAIGVMGQVDMLNRFFKNDRNTSDARTMERRAPSQGGPVSAGWRFKGHAAIPFWRWVCGWSRAARRPSDLGDFNDERFKLPPLIQREHIVTTRTLADGFLFPMAATNRAEELDERRRTIDERCEMAAELTVNTGKPFIVWCHLNPEGELLERLMPDAVHISGADSDDEKEEKYSAFLSGQARGMISKQRIGGWGLNCQHCAHVVEFASHSFESHYQGVRRCYRFGQKNPVVNDIIATEGERGAMESMQRKSNQANSMFDNLVTYMNDAQKIDTTYKFTQEASIPSWL